VRGALNPPFNCGGLPLSKSSGFSHLLSGCKNVSVNFSHLLSPDGNVSMKKSFRSEISSE